MSYAKIRASRNPSSVKHNKWWNYTQINSSRNFGRIFESLSWKTGFKNPAFNQQQQQQQQPVSTLNLFIYTCVQVYSIPSRERSHIPPNGNRKIIDSKVPKLEGLPGGYLNPPHLPRGVQTLGRLLAARLRHYVPGQGGRF